MINNKKWPYKVRLMLDSGVFSAWSRGQTIDIKQYIKYLKRNEKHLFSYVNCDVIPGRYGTKRTSAEIRASGLGSYRNQQILKEAGLHPIPVFHQDESFEWLERLLKDGEPYIGISTSKDLWAKDQRRWLDQVFSILTDQKGRPLVKLHGFGITNPRMLTRYPFYSVDSTTWSLTPGYGQIVIPTLGDPEFYGKAPIRVIMSGVQHQHPTNQRLQYEAMAAHVPSQQFRDLRKETVDGFLGQECDLGNAETRYGTTIRRQALLTYYIGLTEAIQHVRFNEPISTMLSPYLKVQAEASKRKPVSIPQVLIMYATSLLKERSFLLNNAGADTRLLSYYELREKSDQTLIDYITTGMVGEWIRRKPKSSWYSESYRNYRRLAMLARLDDYDKREEEQ